MSATTQIPRERLEDFFNQFSRRFLIDGSPEAVDVEVLEPDWGAQYLAQGARLLGITYDPRTNALEFEIDSGDHRVYGPQEVWVLEEQDGFLSAIEVVRPDSTREVVSIRRVGVRRLH